MITLLIIGFLSYCGGWLRITTAPLRVAAVIGHNLNGGKGGRAGSSGGAIGIRSGRLREVDIKYKSLYVLPQSAGDNYRPTSGSFMSTGLVTRNASASQDGWGYRRPWR